MEKEVISAASVYTEKYFFNNKFNGLPKEVQNELKEITIVLAQRLHGIFSIGVYEDGFVFIESSGEESDFNYDEIGAGLEIKRIESEKKNYSKALNYGTN